MNSMSAAEEEPRAAPTSGDRIQNEGGSAPVPTAHAGSQSSAPGTSVTPEVDETRPGTSNRTMTPADTTNASTGAVEYEELPVSDEHSASTSSVAAGNQPTSTGTPPNGDAASSTRTESIVSHPERQIIGPYDMSNALCVKVDFLSTPMANHGKVLVASPTVCINTDCRSTDTQLMKLFPENNLQMLK